MLLLYLSKLGYFNVNIFVDLKKILYENLLENEKKKNDECNLIKIFLFFFFFLMKKKIKNVWCQYFKNCHIYKFAY